MEFMVFQNIQKANAPMTVNVTQVMTGDIEEIVSVSGNIVSDETKSYYADVAAPIDVLELHAGDRVEKGDVLYTFDAEELDLAKKQAELNLQQANGNYSGTMEKNSKSAVALKGNSMTYIHNRLDEITNEVDALNDKITEKTSRMNQTLTDLQKTGFFSRLVGIVMKYLISQKLF